MSVVLVKGDLSFDRVTNILGTSGMTHSGRIFTAPEPPVRSKDPKGKTKAGVEESDKAGSVPDDEVITGRFAKEEGDFRKKRISAKEVTDFL